MISMRRTRLSSLEGGNMSDKLAVVRHLVDEHRTIAEHIKLVGDSMSDPEAIFALQKSRGDWIPGRPGAALPEKQRRLYQLMSSLEEGLTHHFDHEERVLPPILGELLVEALGLDHRELKEEIGNAKSIVADLDIEESSREELLYKESRIREMLGSIIQKKAEHLDREEILLDMARRALEERERPLLAEAADD